MNSALSFSIAGIGITQGNHLLVSSRIPGRVTAEIAPELTITRTGGSSYPAGARAAASDGRLSIILNERPLWIDSLLGEGGSMVRAGSPNAATFVQVSGSSITAAGFPLVAVNPMQPMAAGRYEIIATGADTVQIIAVTTAGVFPLEASATGQGLPIGTTGAMLTLPSGGLNAGDRAYYEVGADAGLTETLAFIPPVRRFAEFGLLFLSSEAEGEASVVEYQFPRVVLNGANIEAEADAAPIVEIEGRVLVPLDGRAVVQRRNIHRS